MTENLLNDEYSNEILNDGINDQTLIPNIVVVEPTTSTTTLVRKNSVVIPSISNSSISSVIQIENENENKNNTLLPVCTSNSLGRNIYFYYSICFIFFIFVKVILVQHHYLYWIVQYQIQHLLNKMKHLQHLFNVDHFHQVVHHHQHLLHHLQHQHLNRNKFVFAQINK